MPFEAAIRADVAGIMVGHLSFPLVDPVAGRPASLSPVFVSGLLRTDMGFNGLILTDDLGQMKAVTVGYTPGEAAVEAVVAGSDVLLSVGPLESQREMVDAVTAAVDRQSRRNDLMRQSAVFLSQNCKLGYCRECSCPRPDHPQLLVVRLSLIGSSRTHWMQ